MQEFRDYVAFLQLLALLPKFRCYEADTAFFSLPRCRGNVEVLILEAGLSDSSKKVHELAWLLDVEVDFEIGQYRFIFVQDLELNIDVSVRANIRKNADLDVADVDEAATAFTDLNLAGYSPGSTTSYSRSSARTVRVVSFTNPSPPTQFSFRSIRAYLSDAVL